MSRIRTLVHGAAGRMGQEVLAAVGRDPDLEPVGAIDVRPLGDTVALPDGKSSVPFFTSAEKAIAATRPQVIVDFSVAEATRSLAPIAARNRVHLVIGTTGLSPDDVSAIEKLCQQHATGAVVAPNFALGAVLLMHLSAVAAKYFDSAEIIELHHDAKLDAPSGTALATAKGMVQARGGKPFKRNVPKTETLPGTRAGQQDGVTIHSVRLPGLLAHQEVIFGTQGQTLGLRHDTIGRDCYMPGVVMAVKEVVRQPRFVYGLDKLLGLG